MSSSVFGLAAYARISAASASVASNAAMSASTMSFSASAKTPSAQATLTSDFTIAMFCSCMLAPRRVPQGPPVLKRHPPGRGAPRIQAGSRATPRKPLPRPLGSDRVRIRDMIGAARPSLRVEVGSAWRPASGYAACGDVCAVVPNASGTLLCLADGLGHGDAARASAQVVCDHARAHAGEALEPLL